MSRGAAFTSEAPFPARHIEELPTIPERACRSHPHPANTRSQRGRCRRRRRSAPRRGLNLRAARAAGRAARAAGCAARAAGCASSTARRTAKPAPPDESVSTLPLAQPKAVTRPAKTRPTPAVVHQ